MDPVWLLCAFGFGYLVKRIGLPPLVGFLAAGFVLKYFGVEQSALIDGIANFGVILLLFTIGLKLELKQLLKPQIWLTSSLHMAITIVLLSLIIWSGVTVGLAVFSDLTIEQILLISFALSFSSTIFAVKILEETGTSTSTHGRIAIGILIMQDIFAVLFLTMTSDEAPSPWAFGLLLLLLIPWLIKKTPLSKLLDDSGHGELFLLLGILIPTAGAALFSEMGLKADLGAVVLGVLLSGHHRAGEMAKAMMSFKDLFLIGFFLSIGLSGLPSWQEVTIAVFFTLLLPLKMILFFLILTRLKLRARTSFITTLNLSNYSEFGLIVGAAAVAKGWLPPHWMLIFALCISFTFILAAPMNMAADRIYALLQRKLLRFESDERLPEDETIEFLKEEVVVFGMGRTGNQVYEVMEKKYGKKVLGIDQNHEKIDELVLQGKNVIQGDAMDLNFWQRINLSDDPPSIILATSSHITHMQVIKQLNLLHCDLAVAAISRFEDEMVQLQEAGVKVVFNLYEEAGAGFAEHAFNSIYKKE
jgi:predicted Kef-type K+ transport protein